MMVRVQGVDVGTAVVVIMMLALYAAKPVPLFLTALVLFGAI